MKLYELTYLISPELSEEEVKAFQEKVVSFIKEEDGMLEEEKTPLIKKLAYPIKKQVQAFLSVITFHSNPEKIAGLEKKLKMENQILRYLLLTIKKQKTVLKPRRFPLISKKPKAGMPEKEKKVELKEIEEKLEEILKET